MLLDPLDYLAPWQLAVLLQSAIVSGFLGFVWFCHWLVKQLPKSRLRDELLKERWVRFGKARNLPTSETTPD